MVYLERSLEEAWGWWNFSVIYLKRKVYLKQSRKVRRGCVGGIIPEVI